MDIKKAFDEICEIAIQLCETDSERLCILEEKTIIQGKGHEAYLVFCYEFLKSKADITELNGLSLSNYNEKDIMDCYIMRRLFIGQDLYRVTNYTRKAKFRDNGIRISFYSLKQTFNASVLDKLNELIKNTAEKCNLYLEKPLRNNQKFYSGYDFEYDIVDTVLVSDKPITEEEISLMDRKNDRFFSIQNPVVNKMIEIVVMTDDLY